MRTVVLEFGKQCTELL